MILIINEKTKEIKFYTDSGSKTFKLEDINNLEDLMKNGSFYVVNAAFVRFEDLKKIVSNNFPDLKFKEKIKQSISNPKKEIKKVEIEEDLYVRYRGKKGRNGYGGGLYIEDIKVNFENILDFKPLKYLDSIGFSKSSQIKALIKANVFEILPYSKMVRRIDELELTSSSKKNKEKELDDITVKTSLDKYLDKIESGDDGLPSDVIEIEVDGSNSRGANNNENSLVGE